MHAMTLTGKTFNFAGPGTCFKQRKVRGDKPINYSDQCAKLHDYWYDKKDATWDQIKRADEDFVRCGKASPNYRVGDSVNKKLMTSVFAGKRQLEQKLGLNPLRGTSSQVEKKQALLKTAGKVGLKLLFNRLPRKDRLKM